MKIFKVWNKQMNQNNMDKYRNAIYMQRSEKMNLQILISTVNQTDYSLLDRMNIRCDAIVINQCGKNAVEEFEYKGVNIKWISMQERGVGLSRNMALLNSTADIVLFADDDMVYADDCASEVKKAFVETPNADVFCFNIKLVNSTKKTGAYRSNLKIERLCTFNSLRYGACVIAARRKTLFRERIGFSLLFGGGAEFCAGEDSLFICDCLQKKLKVYSHTYVLGEVDDSGSSWYTGINDKLFIDRGCLYANAFPRTYKLLYLYYAARLSKINKCYDFRKIYLLFIKGKKIMKTYR